MNYINKKNNLLIYFILTFSGILAGIIVFELYLRICLTEHKQFNRGNSFTSYGLFNKYPDHPDLIKLTSNFKGYYEGKKVFINSNGLRDFEYSYHKNKNIFRIVVLGNSITFGHGVEIDQAFVKILEKKLNTKYNKKIQVINAGIPGYNLKKKVDFFEYEIYKYSPDMVLIELLFNDAEIYNDPELKKVMSNNFYIFPKSIDIQLSKLFLSYKIIKEKLKYFQKKKNNYDDYLYKTINPNFLGWKNFKTSAQKIKKLSKKYRFKLIIVSFIGLYGGDIYLDIESKMFEIFKKYNIPIINLRKYYTENKTDTISPSDAHPGIKGHQIAANGLFSELPKYIKLNPN